MNELYELIKDFCNIIFLKNLLKLDDWINTVQKYDIPELQTFINGIKKDLPAIKNGIIYPYNNALAEGSVNKSYKVNNVWPQQFRIIEGEAAIGELFYVKFN